MKQLNEYLTVTDLEKMFQVSRQTIYEWRKNGLPFVRIGTRVRFDPEEVKQWVEKQNNQEG